MSLLLNIAAESDSSEEDEELPEEVQQTAHVNGGGAEAAAVVDTLKAFEESFLGRFGAASVEFQEASQLVLVDCWNVTAWLTMVEEVEHGRGGSTGTVEVYSQFLDQFPRATKIWMALVNHHLSKNETEKAEEAFKSCLTKCRDAELWVSYLAVVKSKTVDKISKYSEQYANAKKSVEAAFERALDNLGTTCEASVVWAKYLDFVKEWPDTSPMDASIKRRMMRSIYQRVVCLPVDDLDDFWREYEELETVAGEHLAAQLLPELRTKCQHAKVVNRDRRRLMSKIVFDRISTPPTNSLAELQQLEAWNKFAKYEIENPGHLTPELHIANMRCLFERALCCHRHHAEVWLAFSRFELALPQITDAATAGLPGDNSKQAKTVLKEGIECNSQVCILRIALAELEEATGGVAAAREVLRQAFMDTPNAFTFSVLQRHIRRVGGKTEARKFFSETMTARLDGVLNYEVYLAHAAVEFDINGDLSAAIKAMELARAVRPSLSRNESFVLSCAAILRRLGQVEPIRWLFYNALGEIPPKSADKENVVSDNQSRLRLWEEFLKIELSMGLSDIARLAELRANVVSARESAPPLPNASVKRQDFLSSDDVIFFEYPSELFEKYSVTGVSLPLVDAGVKERCRGSALVEEMLRKAESEIKSSDASHKGRGVGGVDVHSALDVDSSILSGLPAFFKELLAKLPTYTGPTPDVDAFVDRLKRTVLPPRPGDEPLHRRSGHEENVLDGATQLNKRRRIGGRRDDETAYEGGMDIIEDVEAVGDMDGGFDADEVATVAMESRDDVFKRRHRLKLANE